MSRELGQLTLGGQDKRTLWLPVVAAARLSENIPGSEGLAGETGAKRFAGMIFADVLCYTGDETTKRPIRILLA